jgi:putative flippase GtrA
MNYTIRYLVVGGCTTVGYFFIATYMEKLLGYAVTVSSIIAFICMLPLAYIGHKLHTFRSKCVHRKELPKFIASAVLGIVLSTIIPWVTTERFGLDSMIGFAIICVVVPVTNYYFLSRFVFSISLYKHE